MAVIFPAALAPDRPRNRFMRSYCAAAIAAIVGLVLTYAAVEAQRRSAEDKAAAETQLAIEGRIKNLQTNFARYEDLVTALRAFIEGSGGTLETHEFNVVISGLLRDRPGIQALAYVPRVRGTARQAYETLARDSGIADFEFKERQEDGSFVRAGERDEYFPVYNVESKGDGLARGFDLASDEKRKRAMDRARDTGKMAVTRRLKLARDQWGFLLVAPVYFPIQNARTVEERQANLAGFAVGVFRFSD